MVLVASPPALPRIESVPFRLTAVTKPETVRIQYKRIMLGRNKNQNLTFVSYNCFFRGTGHPDSPDLAEDPVDPVSEVFPAGDMPV